MGILLYLASLKLSGVAGWLVAGWLGGWVVGWLENLILMKTWTWTLDFDLGFVKINIINQGQASNAGTANVLRDGTIASEQIATEGI